MDVTLHIVPLTRDMIAITLSTTGDPRYVIRMKREMDEIIRLRA